MKLSDAYPSPWIHTTDLDPEGTLFTIDGFVMEQIKNQGSKPILTFRGNDKRLILNKTNLKKLSELFGDDSNNLYGKKILLVPKIVQFQGEDVKAIRIQKYENGQGLTHGTVLRQELEAEPEPEPELGFREPLPF